MQNLKTFLYFLSILSLLDYFIVIFVCLSASIFSFEYIFYLEKVPEIVIKEWVWSKSNKYNKPDLVPSVPLGWPVPTVTRLWFGSGPEDNKKRLQAFLTCMRSNSPQMFDPLFVPQHLILLCCVLR